ncbi:hypothetical protein BDZ89DRAFT_245363 [Hymenopellis radicata]|nr:hypothetical protein BDZ89DRAFT_245363 [Hymenopellis radicata]
MASIVSSPPPTTNWLTMRERAQLRRKAKKLGQLLGSVPHVMDGSDMSNGSIFFDLRSSSSSLSSSSSGSSSPSTDSTFSSLSRTTSLSSYERPQSRSSIRARRAFSGDSWPKALPLLRLSKASQSLRSIPGSPAYPADAHYLSFSSALSSSDEEESEEPPTLKIPSPNTSRRHKMDKLRRTLGDGVPLDLVFPADKVPTPKSSEEQTPLPPIIDVVAPPPVTEATKDLPPLPATKHSSPRDSMSFPSPHKARRTVRRKPVPVLIPMRAVPPPPPMSIEELERVIDEDMQRLYDIIEDDGSISEAPSEGRWSIVSPREDVPHTSS